MSEITGSQRRTKATGVGKCSQVWGKGLFGQFIVPCGYLSLAPPSLRRHRRMKNPVVLLQNKSGDNGLQWRVHTDKRWADRVTRWSAQRSLRQN
jgi:hypothetical protein